MKSVARPALPSMAALSGAGTTAGITEASTTRKLFIPPDAQLWVDDGAIVGAQSQWDAKPSRPRRDLAAASRRS